MNDQLLRAQAGGELGRPLSVMLGMASLSLGVVAWFLVWRALPREASLAQLALPVLALGAVPGLFQILTLLVKVFQGGRVHLER